MTDTFDLGARLLRSHCRNIALATENTALLMTDTDLSADDRRDLEEAQRRIERALQQEPCHEPA